MRDAFGNKLAHVKRMKSQTPSRELDPASTPSVSEDLLKATTIVVTVFNSLRTLDPLVESLKKHTSPLVKFIFVNDCSDSFTTKYLKKLPLKRCKVLENKENLKYTKTINKGFNQAAKDGCKYIVALNSDVLVTEGWLERLLVAAESGDSVGIVCPYMSNAALLTLEMPNGASYHATAQRLAVASTKDYPNAVTPVGACMLVSSQLWQECGPFDEEESPEGYGEECFFWVKALKAGWKAIIADDCYVYHESHASFGKEADGRERKAVDNFLSKNRAFYTVQFSKAKQHNKLPHLKNTIRSFSVKDNKPNVCFYITNIQLCGGILALVNICNELNEMGVNATIAYERDLSNEMRLMPCKFSPIVLSNKANNWLADGGFKEGYIVATAWFTGDFVLNLCNQYKGLKPMAFIQDREDLFRLPNGQTQYSRRSQFEKYLIVAKQKCVVNSNWVYESLKTDYKFLDQNMDYVPIGVDPFLFYPTGAREMNKRVRILSFCRPSTPRRGYHLMSDLYVELHKKYFGEIELFVYGEGSNTKVPCKALGRLAQAQLAKEMAKADILIEPSSVQGWGMPGQEMMATEGCLVSTDNGGVHNYGKHGKNCLIGGKSVESMLEQVSLAIENPNLRMALGKQARKDMLSFSWRNIAEHWKEALL